MPGNSTPDYYWVLQVNSMAEKEVIDAAYRGLAKKYHPDRYKGSDGNERMREINLAYEVLGDQDKRLAYDVRRSQQSTAQKDTSSRPEYQGGQAKQETANTHKQSAYTQGTTSQETEQRPQQKASAGNRSADSQTGDYSHRKSPRPESPREQKYSSYSEPSTYTGRRTRDINWFAVFFIGISIVLSVWGGWIVFHLPSHGPGWLPNQLSSTSYAGTYYVYHYDQVDQVSNLRVTFTSAKQNGNGRFDISGNFTIQPPLEGSGPFYGTLTNQNIQLKVNGKNGVSITWVGSLDNRDDSISGTYTARDGETGGWNVSPV